MSSMVLGKEDTAKELQDHAADTQDTLVDAVENAEVRSRPRGTSFSTWGHFLS